jgi:DNA-binding CsgD family transcriptional regulator
MFEQVETPTFIDITIVHIAIYLLIPVLLGKNRLRALISASFAFSIINLAQLPTLFFILLVVFPFIDSLSYMEFLHQYPQIFYCGLLLSNIVITVSCLFAANWLRETKLKPPLKIYVFFNLLFVLFPLAILRLHEDILSVLSISFLSSAIICTFFLIIILFLFYLYTRLTQDNLTTVENETEASPPLVQEVGEYALFIQYLSRRELEVIKSIIAGNISYKEISAALNISVNTVKIHLKHIYKKTGISSITDISSLFRGFTTPPPPSITRKLP